MEIDQRLQGIYREDLIEERKVMTRDAYEERVVKKILAKAGLESIARELALQAKDLTGKARVSVAGFRAMYPSFPIWLEARKIGNMHEVTFKELFGKFTSTRVYKTWSELRDQAPEDKPFGLIFDWPSVPGTQMIIHNDDLPTTPDDHAVRIERRIDEKFETQIITIEQLDACLSRILEHWVH